jgi:hypothetical protein
MQTSFLVAGATSGEVSVLRGEPQFSGAGPRGGGAGRRGTDHRAGPRRFPSLAGAAARAGPHVRDAGHGALCRGSDYADLAAGVVAGGGERPGEIGITWFVDR